VFVTTAIKNGTLSPKSIETAGYVKKCHLQAQTGKTSGVIQA